MVGDHAADWEAGREEHARGGSLVLRQRAPAAPGRRTSRVLDVGHAARLAAGAANVERVLLLASHLPETQRALLEAIYRDGMTPLAIARLSGTTSRAVRRRASLIIARITSPAYAVAVTHACGWPALRAGVARRCVVEGMGVRATARMLGVSVHAVRGELLRIRAIADAMTLGAKLPEVAACAGVLGGMRKTG